MDEYGRLWAQDASCKANAEPVWSTKKSCEGCCRLLQKHKLPDLCIAKFSFVGICWGLLGYIYKFWK